MAKKTVEKTQNLVIVESPTKVKSIEKFLGTDYKVVASNGHIRDLPKSKLGVDVENNFEPNYIVIRGRASIIKALREEAKKANKVYLATDPDREGEAISWHIAYLLGLDVNDECRIEFNEITKHAVEQAIANPRKIDINKVDAQQARRVLDRLVGYKLSPLLWKKVKTGLSAGRVQSVAVKLIVDREREIRNFIPEEYWTLSVSLTNEKKEFSFDAKFFGKNGKKIVPANEQETNAILDAIKKSDFIVKTVKKGIKKRKPLAPYTTSLLQQDASRKLGFTTSKTMMIAQMLYEGVKISSTETAGLITYIRTDSTRVSNEAQAAAKKFIINNFGEEYYPETPNMYAGKKNAQDAHEAIRPSYMDKDPEQLKGVLTPDQYKLYKLIYNRFIASQMSNAVYNTLAYEIESAGYTFRAAAENVVFPGFLAVWKDISEDDDMLNALPECTEGQKLKAAKFNPKQNFTQPPARYTEATFIKTMDEMGIGRPSTYVPIISTIIDRGYVVREQKNMVPTELGEIVADLMQKNFPDIADVQFTAEMEDKLDDVENEGNNWKQLITDFYVPFEKELVEADKNIERVKLPERPAGVICEKCGAEMVYKQGRFGEFIACPNYPECKNTKPVVKTLNVKCPKCGGDVVVKKSGKGKTFYGCSNYPECDFMSWDMPTDSKCTVCGSYMVSKRTLKNKAYKKCSNPECPTNKKKAAEDKSE